MSSLRSRDRLTLGTKQRTLEPLQLAKGFSLETNLNYDVLIIGAGPSGTCAASLLNKKGFSVALIEKEVFPRFSIGESLLPQSMVFLERAGLLEDAQKAGFQKKDGAAFLSQGKISVFDFEDKSTKGPHITFQVERAKFDKVLADTCEKNGIPLFFQHVVNEIQFDKNEVRLKVLDTSKNQEKTFTGKFILDASGFGRVLPKLLKLDRKSAFPNRRAVFGHRKVNYPESFDINKILITVDDSFKDVWLWTIPLSPDSCSIGVVATEEYYNNFPSQSNEQILQRAIDNIPQLKEIMSGSTPLNECRTIIGYASDVSSLHGDRFALLGNAGEFLDPIFSSGVTIALHSASLAADLVEKQLKGQAVDWEKEFSQPLKVGVETFKTFVRTWYTGELQSILFYPKPETRIKKLLCSILAGYAWDQSNPYVLEPMRSVSALASFCANAEP